MTEEQDFKLRPTADQNWVLFEAISKISETIARIDQYGCSLVRDKQYKKSWWKKFTIFGASFGGGLGFVFMIGKLIKCF